MSPCVCLFATVFLYGLFAVSLCGVSLLLLVSFCLCSFVCLCLVCLSPFACLLLSVSFCLPPFARVILSVSFCLPLRCLFISLFLFVFIRDGGVSFCLSPFVCLFIYLCFVSVSFFSSLYILIHLLYLSPYITNYLSPYCCVFVSICTYIYECVGFGVYLQLMAAAQCMGDVVVQRSSQLHWGINLSPFTKAESSNCAGPCFSRLCPLCMDALLCGAQSHLLKQTLRRLLAVNKP